MVNDSSNKVNIFNNIIYNDDTVTNAVYAFRIDGKKHSGSKVAFNTIYKIDNGFYLEDNNITTIDFGIQNNIISPTLTGITNSGTSGRFNVTYNLFRNSPGAPYATGTGNITGNPQFIQPDGPSMYGLMLMPSSPCFDTGVYITTISRDYLRVTRTPPKPTLGAFENLMDCTWTGTSGTNWHTYQNWVYQVVPMNFMAVTIPNTVNDPIVSTGNATCKSISLLNGATLLVRSPRSLTLSY
jgi:hypothetical protein